MFTRFSFYSHKVQDGCSDWQAASVQGEIWAPRLLLIPGPCHLLGHMVTAAGEREVDEAHLLLTVLSPHCFCSHSLATLDDKGGGNVVQLGAQEEKEMSLVTSYSGL